MDERGNPSEKDINFAVNKTIPERRNLFSSWLTKRKNDRAGRVETGYTPEEVKEMEVEAFDKRVDQFLQSRIGREKEFQEKQIKDVRFTRAFSNHIGFIKYNDGQKGVFKPANGESYKFITPERPHGTICNREIAAYRIDDIMELGLVPLTVNLTLGTYGSGSCQQFIPDAYAYALQYEGVNWREMRAMIEQNQEVIDQQSAVMRVLDYVIYNLDRNGGNFLVTQTGDLHAIDNGVSFAPKEDPSKAKYEQSSAKPYIKQVPENVKAFFEKYFSDQAFYREIIIRRLQTLLPNHQIDVCIKRLEAVGTLVLRDGEITKDQYLSKLTYSPNVEDFNEDSESV